jgi:hypothetical protein
MTFALRLFMNYFASFVTEAILRDLNMDHIDFRFSSKQTSHDFAVEVFIKEDVSTKLVFVGM